MAGFIFSDAAPYGGGFKLAVNAAYLLAALAISIK